MGHENFKSKVEKSKVIKVTLAGYKLAGGFYFSNPGKPLAAMAGVPFGLVFGTKFGF